MAFIVVCIVLYWGLKILQEKNEKPKPAPPPIENWDLWHDDMADHSGGYSAKAIEKKQLQILEWQRQGRYTYKRDKDGNIIK